MRQRSKGIIVIVCAICFCFVWGIGARGQTKRVRRQTEHLILQCRLLIDPASGKTFRDPFIEINNGRIMRIGTGKMFKAVKTAKFIDFREKFIIPGLIDTHGHLFGGLTKRHTTSDILQALYLAAGVTTVRSPGSQEPEGDIGMQYRIDSGRFIGPRYFNSGPYIEGDPVTVAWMQPVKTPEEVRLKIDQWLRSGATSVKIYAAMKGELLRTAIEHGHSYGVKVIGHIGAVSYREAIEMGIDELFHGILAMPDVIPADTNRTDYKKFYAALAQTDMKSEEIRDIVRMAAEYNVVLTPTAGVFDPIDWEACRMEEQKKYYSPEAWAVLEERYRQPMIPNAKELQAKNIEFIRMAHGTGCLLSTGTDQVGFMMLPGFSLWREMEIFTEAGMRPMDVLKAATLNGAYAIGRSDMIGSLKPGRLADMVVLDANPLKDISHIRKVHRVVKGGVIYEPENLLKTAVGRVH